MNLIKKLTIYWRLKDVHTNELSKASSYEALYRASFFEEGLCYDCMKMHLDNAKLLGELLQLKNKSL